jgi:hypothetical protein
MTLTGKKLIDAILQHQRSGAHIFKARLLAAIDDAVNLGELGAEVGGGYVLGPAFKPDTEESLLAMRAWIERFKI